MVTGRGGQVATSIEERAPKSAEFLFVGRPEFDLLDSASIERVVAEFAPDLVINTAAYTAVDRAEDEPTLAEAANGIGPGVLARAAKRIHAPIFHLSTDYVFDGALDRAYREDDLVNPIGVYGKTKLAGEEAIRASGAEYAIIRTSWVYSPFGTNFVKTMLRLAADRDELKVVDDQFGCPTSALDVADALFAMMRTWSDRSDLRSSGIYHFAGTGDTSWAGLAREVFVASAARGGPSACVIGIPTRDWPTKAARPTNSRLDCSAFGEAFGFRAPDWQQSLREVVARLI